MSVPGDHHRRLHGLVLVSALLHALLFAALFRPAESRFAATDPLQLTLLAAPPRVVDRQAPPSAPKATAQLRERTGTPSRASASNSAEPARPRSTDPRNSRHSTRHILPAPSRPVSAGTRTAAPGNHARGKEEASLSSDGLRVALISTLQPYFSYPRIGRRMGWQGEVRLHVTIEAHGALTGVSLAHSSGIAALDQAALASASAITGSAAISSLLQGRRFDMELPVTYRLIDG